MTRSKTTTMLSTARQSTETVQSAGAITRIGILDAAASIIVEQGYEACTMRAVAARVNIKAGSLYYHFASKEVLMEEIINLGIQQLFDRVTEAVGKVASDAPFMRKLEAAVATHLDGLVGEDRKLQVHEHFPPALKRRSRRIREKYAKLWVQLFAEGVARKEIDADIDLEALALYFLGSLNRVPVWLKSSGRTSGAIADLATRVLMRGVGVGPRRLQRG